MEEIQVMGRHQVDTVFLPKVTVSEKLDDALDKSFPASDPVSLGHSDHIGQPKTFPKSGSKLPKGLKGLTEKR
jgi:hypothetical protein